MSLEEIKDSISHDLLRHIAGQWNQRKKYDINFPTVQTIMTVGNPAYDYILDTCFTNEDTEYQLAAAYVLGIIGYPAITQLEKGITHKNPVVRKEAIAGLVNIGDKAVPILGEALKIPDEEIRRQVTHGLIRLGEVAENYLCEAITDEDDSAFRMDAERAVYVDNRNIPGWGTVLVEWYERIGYASAFYDLDGNERQIACRDAGVDYYALYGIEPDDIEPVLVKWKDKSLIACPITDSDN